MIVAEAIIIIAICAMNIFILKHATSVKMDDTKKKMKETADSFKKFFDIVEEADAKLLRRLTGKATKKDLTLKGAKDFFTTNIKVK